MRWSVDALLGALLLAVATVLASAIFGTNCSAHREWMARGQLSSLKGKVEQYRIDTGHLPTTLEDLVLPGNQGLGPYSKPSELIDPWRAPFYYRVIDARGTFALFTLGSDGLVGGDGPAADQEASLLEQ